MSESSTVTEGGGLQEDSVSVVPVEPVLPVAPTAASGAGWRRHPGVRLLGCMLLSFLLLSAAFWLCWPKMTAQGQANGQVSAVDLPWVFHSAGPGNSLTVDMNVGWLTPQRWHVIPDDSLRSITINGRSVSLDGLPPGALQDFGRGFEIDLGPYLERGPTSIVFTLDNGGGDGGLAFRPRMGFWRTLLLASAFLPLLFGFSRLFGLRKLQILILGAALLVICAYWMATPWHVRTHDTTGIDGHYAYVTWIAKNLALPSPTEGWTFYHPPLYYMLGAAVWRWAQWLSLPGPELLQAMSICLWLVFLTASAGALRRVLRGRSVALALATLALAFWPSGLIHAIRLGNDAALFASAGIATWFAIRWWQGRRRADLVGMAIACAVSLLCKSNAVALCAALGLLVFMTVLRRNRRKRRAAMVDTALFGGVVVCGLFASFAVRVYFYLQGSIPNWLIANTGGLNSGLRVPVELKYFLPLDVPTFLTSPWMAPFDDASGRANFWNYLLRSSLSGEFDFPGLTQRVVAYGWGVVLLVLFISLLCPPVWRAVGCSARAVYRARPWLLLGCMWLASLMAIRIITPYSCSNDFRYVLPVLLPALVFWSQAGRLPRLMLAVIALSSAVFFLSL